MELSNYSAQFLDTLLKAFPEFGELVATGPEHGCFTIQLRAPSGSPFLLATEEEDRITVGFDDYHTHFGGWADSVPSDDYASAISYIRRLVNGDYLIGVWSENGRFAGSSSFLRGEVPQWKGRSNVDQLVFTIKGWHLEH